MQWVVSRVRESLVVVPFFIPAFILRRVYGVDVYAIGGSKRRRGTERYRAGEMDDNDLELELEVEDL
jgi:hypothetical protein